MITVFAENGGLTLNGDNGQLASDIKTAKTLNYYLQKFNIDPDFELVLWELWVLQLLKVEMKQKRQTLHES